MEASIETQFAEINKKISELEEVKATLLSQLLEKMTEQGITNNETEEGKFVMAWRKSYEYSLDTEMMAVRLKEIKKKEENEGVAQIKNQTTYLRFLPRKAENERD